MKNPAQRVECLTAMADNMTYHHVIAKVGSGDKFRCLFSDISAADLRKKFILPYERGTGFFCGSDLISPAEIRSLKIVRTNNPDEVERAEINRADQARIDEFNRTSGGLTIIGFGGGYEPEDIEGAGEDVTHVLIKGPPGFKAGRWAPSKKVMGWFFGILASVVAAGAAKWLGWV